MVDNEPLCRKCIHFEFSNVTHTASHTYGPVRSNQIARCTQFYVEIEKEATECHKYENKWAMTMKTMENMAYIMESKRVIGFDNPVIEFVKPEKK